MDYFFKRDWGGAIINTGILACYKCNFTYNYAKHGGAIFNQGILDLENCTFSNNKAYGKGNDVCVGDGGKVKVNGENITSSEGPIYIADGYSMTDVTICTMWCIESTVLLSFLAGAASGGILMAAAIGFAIGGVLGMLTSKIVSTNVFDLNFDATTYAAVLIGGSIVAGVSAGILGYTLLSGVNSCDRWFLKQIGEWDDVIFYDDASTLSSSSSSSLRTSVAEDMIYIRRYDSIISAP